MKFDSPFTIIQRQHGLNGITTYKSNTSRIVVTFIPREHFEELLKDTNSVLHSTGIYCLVGLDCNSMNVYIGKATTLGKRIKNHFKGANRFDFWTTAIVITSHTMDQFTETDISCMEHYIYNRTEEARHYIVHNKQAPQLQKISDEEEDDSKIYINDIRKILSNTRYRFLETPDIPVSDVSTGQLRITSKNGADAFGYYDIVSNHMTVLSGSRTRAFASNEVDSNSTFIKSLINSRIVELQGDGSYKFTKSYEFLCPSQAASIILRNSVDGYDKWLLAGKTLRELLEIRHREIGCKQMNT